ncbi:AP-3 complex subunit beta [Perkinsus chesapeaki]|uniref:AP-3 complex subunit beta n=1 Tax=Perkinsus chesapeaki TaxID=330153 RepID=A0A7J6MXM7_PERCH|nr:AP-3 complex subunit beta [Perkinsus chesapeaki]
MTNSICLALAMLSLSAALGAVPKAKEQTLVTSDSQSSGSHHPPIVDTTSFNVTDTSLMSSDNVGVLANLFAANGTLSGCATKAISIISSASVKAKETAVVVGAAVKGAGERLRPVMTEVGSRAGDLWTSASPVVQSVMSGVGFAGELLVKEVYPVCRDVTVAMGTGAVSGMQRVAAPGKDAAVVVIGEVSKTVLRAGSAVGFSAQYWWYSAILPSLLNLQSLTDDVVLSVTTLCNKFGPPVLAGVTQLGEKAGDAGTRILVSCAPRILDAIAALGAGMIELYTRLPPVSAGLDAVAQKAVEAGEWVKAQLPLACSARTLNSVMTSPLDGKWARVLATSSNCTAVGAAIRQWRAAWHPDAHLNGRGNIDSRLANCTVLDIQAGFQSASAVADQIKAVACGEVKVETATAVGNTRAILRQIGVAIGAPLVGLAAAKLLRWTTR